jgi:hypothetical protein
MTKTHRNDWIRFGCLAAVVLLAAMAAARLVGFLTGPARAEELVTHAVAHRGQDPNDLRQSVDAAKSAAGALKKKNLFAKEPPEEHPVKQIDGILGGEVLIQNKWYKVGDKVQTAKILSIDATGVVVEWKGEKKTFTPFESVGGPDSGPSGPPKPVVSKAPAAAAPKAKTDANEAKPATVSQDDDPFAFMGVTLSAKVREKLLQMWNSLTDEQKQQAKEQWSNMSDEQKQQAVKQMEEHM